jgi:hypothetical protein
VVIGAANLDFEKLEAHRRRALALPRIYDWMFSRPANVEAARRSLATLIDSIDAFNLQADLAAAEPVEASDETLFDTWLRVLNAREELARGAVVAAQHERAVGAEALRDALDRCAQPGAAIPRAARALLGQQAPVDCGRFVRLVAALLPGEPLATRRHIESWSDLGTAFAAEDAVIERRAQAAAAKGCTLRYVQRIDCPTPAVLGGERATQVKASIRLEEVPLDHPHAMVKVRVEQ